MKLKSSMTLFALVSEDDSVFHQVLDTFFGGDADAATLNLLINNFYKERENMI